MAMPSITLPIERATVVDATAAPGLVTTESANNKAKTSFATS